MKTISGIVMLMLFFGCQNRPIVEQACNGEVATLIDHTGLDGCSWVFVLESGRKLEPTNLLEFVPVPVSMKKFRVRYTTRKQVASICMVGAIVDIDCVRALD